jgi:hypothetical protein
MPAINRKWGGFGRPVLSRCAIRIFLIFYATAVWLFVYHPWNVVLLALVAARNVRDPTTKKSG